MATDTRATTFVTGAAGFVGSELVKVLLARRHRAFCLTDSVEAAGHVRRAGGMPAVAARLVMGPVLADHLQADAAFSHIRLRGTGFRFPYPTLDQGLQQVLGALHA